MAVLLALKVALFMIVLQCLSYHEVAALEPENITIAYLYSYYRNKTSSSGDKYVPSEESSRDDFPMFYMAITDINNNPAILPNHRLVYRPIDVGGNTVRMIRQLNDVTFNDRVWAVVGLGQTCEVEARIASAYNMPIIFNACADSTVSDKKTYPTTATTSASASKMVLSAMAFLRYYNWRRITLIHGYYPNNPQVTPIKDIVDKFKKEGQYESLTMQEFTYDYKVLRSGAGAYHEYDNKEVVKRFDDIIDKTANNTRIYVLVPASASAPIGFLDRLREKQLLQTGDYFVIVLGTGDYNVDKPTHWINRIYDSRPDPTIIENLDGNATGMPASFISNMFSVLRGAAFIGRSQQNQLEFSKELNERYSAGMKHFVELGIFNKAFFRRFERRVKGEADYLKKMFTSKQRPVAMYDAVKLYATAVHNILEENKNNETGNVSPMNGIAIIEQLRGIDYTSFDGFETRLDENGEALGNYSVASVQHGIYGATFIKQDEYPFGISPVGVFQKGPNQTLNLKMNGIRYISWIGGKPPLDEPVCGFFNERCPPPEEDPTWKIATGVCVGVLAIFAFLGFFVYRNWKYEQELEKMLWRVAWGDISKSKAGAKSQGFAKSGPMTSKISMMQSLASLRSFTSGKSQEHAQMFVEVGVYKNATVAIKRINVTYVVLTRQLKRELKAMKEMNNANIALFHGACVEAPNVCVLMDYCNRGSLMDVLGNDEINLDSMFIASIVNDILKGLKYLHDTFICCHGNLKTSNCVIDSRWVLKLTDYGLTNFREGEKKDLTAHSTYQGMLWTAPEVLRDYSSTGTIKGDIYAFAFILYEIYGRNGPYGNCELSPEEIVKLVKHTQDPDRPFRPKLAELDTVPKFVTDTIARCWAEYSYERPELSAVKSKLKPLSKGLKSNIMDNMVSIMERYANNLESIIEERTGELIEEKKRTDELLHQMLPKTVAAQLKQGKRVEAETFDLVSIYFSDIVGFTSLSSASTPIQVVDLLNDLYTCFDGILEEYDVYKVETIGDAYMVVSGLPLRNGIKHAAEIAKMSLSLLGAIQVFKVRHKPDHMLKLRIGIHSGSCVAGVVGLKMPRYCLFGDTVNTASRMESNGLPLRIHCSPECKELLDKCGGFVTEERGLVAMKGKGEILTFWVNAYDANDDTADGDLRRRVKRTGDSLDSFV